MWETQNDLVKSGSLKVRRLDWTQRPQKLVEQSLLATENCGSDPVIGNTRPEVTHFKTKRPQLVLN